ncbi:MFS transporter [Streptacidiphilus monticola]|uniref:MFS transporter n=1 Tax=Streptacidiphilus monticola TaxID=2161674 RepID=A0ABW1G578_9ACTN
MTTADVETARRRGGVGAALRQRDFRWWFGAQVFSASGTVTQGVALSWVVLQQTQDALWLSVLTVCQWGPMLLLGPWAGALVDRHDRRRLLRWTQAALALAGLLLAALTRADALPLWAILLVALVSGTVGAVDGPARQVLVVDLVGREGVAGAVGLWEVALNVSRVVGPGVGGALLATTGAAACFLVNGLAYLPALLVLRRLPPHRSETETETDSRVTAAAAGGGPARAGVREGLRYAWRTPVVRACLPMAAASGMLFTMGIALPLLATRALHLGGGGYGTLMAAFGVGGLPGALLAARTTDPTGRQVRRLALATGASVLLTAWSPTAPAAFACMVLTGVTSIWFVACANTLVQLRSAPEMRGRVMGLWGMALPGTVPLTGFLVAAVGDHLGPRAAFSVSGTCLALAALAGWRALNEPPAPAR